MTSESGNPEERHWLLEPQSGAVEVAIAVGEGAELTPEMREAIERLIGVVHGAEVQGYAHVCTTDYTCTSESTTGGRCHPRTVACFSKDIDCHIGIAPMMGGLPS